MKVTFIGLGIMGSRMAARLIAPEIELTVFNRDSKKADLLEALGARVAKDLKGAVAEAEVVFTMLANPDAVEQVSGEMLMDMRKGSLWIDCSTVAPADVIKSADRAEQHGVLYLEAPVAGTRQPAENGELVFFVGGEDKALKDATPLLQKMGKKIIHLGAHGKGAAIKLLVNLMLAQSMLAFSEAMQLGNAMGLDDETSKNVLLNTPVTAPFLQKLRAKLEAGDTSPNFPMDLMLKDLNLVQETAANVGVSLPSAALAKALYAQAGAAEKQREDFSSIYHFIQNQ